MGGPAAVVPAAVALVRKVALARKMALARALEPNLVAPVAQALALRAQAVAAEK
jgi:hypothetical protein